MAVVNVSSTEYLKLTDPRTNGYLKPEEQMMALFAAPFTFAQGAVAGDITSIQSLVKLPSGRLIIFPKMSWIQFSAFGAARTLAIGVSAYQDETDATIAAAPSAFDSAIDVSGAGSAAIGSNMAAATGNVFRYQVRSKRLSNIITDATAWGIDVIATVAGGTIPANATLTGEIVFAAPLQS